MKVALAVALGAGVGLAGALAAGAESRQIDRLAAGSPFIGSVIDHVPVPAVTLVDERGRPVTLPGRRSEPLVVTFMTAACDDTCPAVAQQIRGALDRLDRRVPAVAVAVDPARDTPARARAFLLRQRLSGRLRFALGTRAQLAPAWRGFGIGTSRVADGHSHAHHVARVVLVDRRGLQRVGWWGDELTPEGLAHDLAVLLDEPAAG